MLSPKLRVLVTIVAIIGAHGTSCGKYSDYDKVESTYTMMTSTYGGNDAYITLAGYTPSFSDVGAYCEIENASLCDLDNVVSERETGSCVTENKESFQLSFDNDYTNCPWVEATDTSFLLTPRLVCLFKDTKGTVKKSYGAYTSTVDMLVVHENVMHAGEETDDVEDIDHDHTCDPGVTYYGYDDDSSSCTDTVIGNIGYTHKYTCLKFANFGNGGTSKLQSWQVTPKNDEQSPFLYAYQNSDGLLVTTTTVVNIANDTLFKFKIRNHISSVESYWNTFELHCDGTSQSQSRRKLSVAKASAAGFVRRALTDDTAVIHSLMSVGDQNVTTSVDTSSTIENSEPASDGVSHGQNVGLLVIGCLMFLFG